MSQYTSDCLEGGVGRDDAPCSRLPLPNCGGIVVCQRKPSAKICAGTKYTISTGCSAGAGSRNARVSGAPPRVINGSNQRIESAEYINGCNRRRSTSVSDTGKQGVLCTHTGIIRQLQGKKRMIGATAIKPEGAPLANGHRMSRMVTVCPKKAGLVLRRTAGDTTLSSLTNWPSSSPTMSAH